jgi:hypothetical protein
VVGEVLGLSGRPDLEISPWQVLDFSSTFSIDWRLDSGRQGVFVKIPKVEISKRQVGLVTPADRSFAAAEYDSLTRLSQAWNGADLGVGFVKPRAFLSDYNAIVTERAYARDFLTPFRRSDLCCRGQGLRAGNEVIACLKRLGQALARYHRSCSEDGVFEVQSVRAKLQGYLSRLQELRVDRTLLIQISGVLERLQGRAAPTRLTETIKGLDVRNILIDPENRLFLLDPGRLKKDYREADLARFLVTCRILYWGSLWFFLRLTPHEAFERSFLQGYLGGEEAGGWVLGVFTLKELLKQWLMAHVALGLKRWPPAFKALLKRTYIDPFYRGQIGAELQKLNGVRSSS